MCTLDFSNAGYETGPPVTDVQPAVSEPPVVKKQHRSVKPAAEGIKHVTLAQLIQAGLIKTPLALEKTYKGQRLAAEIQADGSVLFAGTTYNSLSVSAGYARASVVPPPAGREYHSTNGWTFWQYRDSATGRLQTLDGLRRAFHSEHQPRLEVI